MIWAGFPAGCNHLPTEEERQLLRARAKAERESIREVLCEILHEQAE